jgi:hypothetical protein
MPGLLEQAHCMKSRLAAGAAVGANPEQGPGIVPESGGARGTDFDCTALKTLRNSPASINRGQQERESDAE